MMENELTERCRRVGCDRIVRKKDRCGLCHLCWRNYTVEGKLLNREQTRKGWEKAKLESLRRVIKEKRQERIADHDNS
jgi:hypothetical protein